ncbi:uncharacterized protein EI90DRAFT_3118430 [Cantharellus anzutake]|uniref:uncharacterized protein n=1 Tax=Cantharellus anzutake TaxID=1750568 RepID=UPI0019060E36|nr:uncharacterized protein EI90DRAFT_3118430 [Cantharellus anzutake]KAF8337966.1 hypothetical protein EI90DRAFT_3118430 [Cantharellus anzutake]
MFRRAAVSLFLLFTASVFAIPFPQRQVLRRLAPQLRDPVHGETNAKRFAKGLPPLPPARRWNIEASGTETAKRAQGSDTILWNGVKIQGLRVFNGKSNAMGYIQLKNNKYVLATKNDADGFTATVQNNGITHGMNIKADKAPFTRPYLAVLVDPKYNDLGAKGSRGYFGTSESTQLNATPQSGGAVSVTGAKYESVVWDYDIDTTLLTPKWVDSNNNTLTLSIVWGSHDESLYVTTDPFGLTSTISDSRNMVREPSKLVSQVGLFLVMDDFAPDLYHSHYLRLE